MRSTLFVPLALCLPNLLYAQQWYCMNPTFPNSPPHASGMVGFEAAGKFHYGFGTDDMDQIDGSWEIYDPATNTASLSSAQTVGRSQCVAFCVNGYGYVGTGNVYDWFGGGGGAVSYVTSFIQKYDHVAGQFTWGTHFAGGPRLDAVAFTIGNLVYMGGGLDVDTALGTTLPENDLWVFDPVADTWTARANMPSNLTKGLSFVLNGKGYVMPDGSTALWEYDPVADAWAARAPYPGTALNGRCAFALNGLGHVGTGGSPDVQALFTYDPVSNTWASASSMWATGGRTDALTCVIGNSAYVLGGKRNSNTILGDLWRFGPATSPLSNAWTQRPFMPAAARSLPIAFTIGDKGYVGGGSGQNGNLTDFWMYDPAIQAWTARANIPAVQADEGFNIDGIGYVVTAAAANNFFAYDPVADAWSPRADMPGGARNAASSFTMEGKGYVGGGIVGGARTSTFYCYDPLTNTWTQRADIPLARHSSTGFAIGNKGYICAGNFAGSSTTISATYRYDPVVDSWTAVAGYPYNTNGNQNGMCFTIGNRAYVGGGLVGGPTLSRHFHAYDAPTNTWTQLTFCGGGYRYNGVGFSIGDKGYLFGGRLEPDTITPFFNNAERSNDLWEYNPEVISVSPLAFLEGPFDAVAGMMHDSLHAQGLLTGLDPYGANGYPNPGGTYTDMPTQVPANSGNNAIVDRVIVELRDAVNPTIVRATRHVWLQRDGDVVDMDGTSPVRFTLPPGNYHVAVRHRNHLGAMTFTAPALSGAPTTVDFTDPGFATYGTDARKIIGPHAVLWAGDVTFNGQVKYAGAGNDRDPILVGVGGNTPLNVVPGDFAEDVNMDGLLKYAGANNDRDPILLNLPGNVPTAVRNAQLP